MDDLKTELLVKAIHGQTPIITTTNNRTKQIEIRFTTRKYLAQQHPVENVGTILVHPTSGQIEGFLVNRTSVSFAGSKVGNMPVKVFANNLKEVCSVFGIDLPAA